jgi:hypothetical protein
MKYRKKPVIIDAVQWTGTKESWKKITEMGKFPWEEGSAPTDFSFKIKTLEGCMTVNVGDFVIKGVAGEFYPCKPDIFNQTYEPVGEKPEYIPECEEEDYEDGEKIMKMYILSNEIKPEEFTEEYVKDGIYIEVARNYAWRFTFTSYEGEDESRLTVSVERDWKTWKWVGAFREKIKPFVDSIIEEIANGEDIEKIEQMISLGGTKLGNE